MTQLTHAKEMQNLIEKGAVFYCSHSGGKDSQAMYTLLKDFVPADQLVVVHADLGSVEWSGVQGHIKDNITEQLNVVRANKTFLEMVERRGMWPSPAYRQCTSDLKTGPIMKFIRNDVKARGATIAINCMGLRAEESSARSKKNSLEINKAQTVNKRVTRTVYNWLPIFDMLEGEVFDTIYAADQKPFWAYGKRGELNSRLSCVFCIMGSKNDLQHGARSNPELFKQYIELENKIGHTMFVKGKNPVKLEDHVGLKLIEVINL